MTNINSVSGSLLGKTTIITYKRNPANIDNHKNGRQGGYYTSRVRTSNLNNADKTNHLCNYNNSDKPQLPVTNTSSVLKRRTSRCTSGSLNCGKTNFKLQNPLDHAVSSIISRNEQRASQCVINPNKAYNNAINRSFTETTATDNTTIEVCCAKPIVKVTDTPSTSVFLKTSYLKNNCLPPTRGSISAIKRMQNKNCGNSIGGC